MTAVRLRGKDAIDRALEARRLHLDEMMTVEEIADHYQSDERSVYRWLQLAKKHALPPIDDKLAWFNLLVQDQGSRLEDAKDADSVKIGQFLAQLLGVGSAEEIRAQLVQIEAAKVALIAQAFDQAIAGLPNRTELRSRFMEAIEQ